MCRTSRTCFPLPPQPTYASDPPKQWRAIQQAEHSLVDPAHLPRPGDHAATIDDARYPVKVPVLLDEELGGELRRAVKGPGARQGKVLADSRRRNSRQLLPVEDGDAGRSLFGSNLVEPADGVDAARRQKNDPGAVSLRALQTMKGPEQIRLDDVGGRAAVPGENGGLGGAFEQKIHFSFDGREVLRLSDVAMHEFDAFVPQSREIQLRAAAPEVVESHDSRLRVSPLEPYRQVRAYESGAAGDQESQRARHPSFPSLHFRPESLSRTRPLSLGRLADVNSFSLPAGADSLRRIHMTERARAFAQPLTHPWTG